MSVVDVLFERNARFALDRIAVLLLSPSSKLMLICCVDPRVDPTEVLRVELGEAAVIRNVGGQVTRRP